MSKINRRRFLRTTTTIAVSGLTVRFSLAEDAASRNAPLAGQFRGRLSAVKTLPPSATPRPDDLDLSAMAKAALNYLRGNPEPRRDYECRFSLGLLGIPNTVPLLPSNRWGFDPVSLGDTDCRMEWQYAHMREMSGQKEADAVERGVRARVRGYLHDDDHLGWINPGAYVGEAIEGEWVGTWTTAKLLYSMAEEFQRTGDRAVRRRARQTFVALKGLALWDGPRAYYPGLAPFKDGQWLRSGWCADHSRNYPFIVEPCVRYYEATGDSEALDFAKAVTEGFLAGSQKDQRELRVDPRTGAFLGHTHIHTHAAWGVAHLGAILKEPRYLDWARKVYDFVLSQGTDYGWYPESMPSSGRAEVCAVGDMVSLGSWLARGGRPHYWDHVERTVRNELRRAQFSLTPAFLRLFREIHREKPKEVVDGAIAELRRLEGGFVAQPTYNDWVGYPNNPKLGTPGMNNNGVQMMGCCPPEGMRGLWEAWSGAVIERPEGVLVNMTINRDHPAAKVEAYAAESGGLRVIVRKPGKFLLRPPAWAARDGVRLTRNGGGVPVSWAGPAGAYVLCDNAAAGEQLGLRWPVPVFQQTFAPQGAAGQNRPLVVGWTGNRVDAIEPRGKYLPMF
jgi:hypothetical protein